MWVLVIAGLIQAMAGAAVVLVVTRSTLPPMGWLRRWALRTSPDWLGKLLSCPFCFGFWTALVLHRYHFDLRFDVTAVLAVWMVQSVIAAGVYHAIKSMGKSREEQELEQHHDDEEENGTGEHLQER